MCHCKYGLIQEELKQSPWHMLIACMMLNLTSIKQVRPVIERFFRRWPTHDVLNESHVDELSCMLHPLGMYNRRAHAIIQMSKQYVTWNGIDPRCLYGVGQYGYDSYMIFVNDDRSIVPHDRRLLEYVAWRSAHACRS